MKATQTNAKNTKSKFMHFQDIKQHTRRLEHNHQNQDKETRDPKNGLETGLSGRRGREWKSQTNKRLNEQTKSLSEGKKRLPAWFTGRREEEKKK